jgi:hypothetical protein
MYLLPAARVRTVRVQAVAATVNNKTVLAPPYNVLITGSTKGSSMFCEVLGVGLQLLVQQ